MKVEDKRVIGFRYAVTSLLAVVLFANPTVMMNTSAASRQQRQSSALVAGGRAILWQEPRDIERRDLFYGAGGRSGAPAPSSGFIFVRHSTSGTQKKIIVKDSSGCEWTVKFGPEASPETTATRIICAAGYHVDQDYFVRQARIVGKEQYDARDVRFERRDEELEEVGNWKWKESPFEGTREMDGLKVLMALIKNWDLKSP